MELELGKKELVPKSVINLQAASSLFIYFN